MKLSHSAITPLKNPPSDADTINHKLLVQAGFVRQLMAGVYTFLPFGLRVLNKVRTVIRQEMNSIGGQEIFMPALHPSRNWKITGAWDNVDVLFKINSRTKREYALGQSHEEVITPLAKEMIASYKDLPLALYQIQFKFRDELRAKSGLLRGREFEMKDMYSFHADQKDFDRFYETVKTAYLNAYQRLDLTAKVTEASGGSFSEKISYEFMVLTNAGEDDILYCPSCEFCVNTEIAKVKPGDACPKCQKDNLEKARASEVGNVFDLGQKYTKDFDLTFTDTAGKKHYPIMGCYGFGTTRTMGVVVEHFHDDRGIIWPRSIAPFLVSLITLDNQTQESQAVYDLLQQNNIEVLWDDRDISAGQKFADADLIGNPFRLVISDKSLKAGGYELKPRNQDQTTIVSKDQLLSALNA